MYETLVKLRRKHTQAEVKALQKCAKFNIPSPKYFESIPKEGLILVEYLNGVQLKELIDEKKITKSEIGKIMGEIVGQVHARRGSSTGLKQLKLKIAVVQAVRGSMISEEFVMEI